MSKYMYYLITHIEYKLLLIKFYQFRIWWNCVLDFVEHFFNLAILACMDACLCDVCVWYVCGVCVRCVYACACSVCGVCMHVHVVCVVCVCMCM